MNKYFSILLFLLQLIPGIYLLIWIYFAFFTNNTLTPLIVVPMSAIIILLYIRNFAKSLTYPVEYYVPPNYFFINFITSVFLIVITFASIYNKLGIENNLGEKYHDPVICLYFSLVTFTTLGYGDFRPTCDARLLAAFEALLGYVIMGIYVGIFVFIVTKKYKHHDKSEIFDQLPKGYNELDED